MAQPQEMAAGLEGGRKADLVDMLPFLCKVPCHPGVKSLPFWEVAAQEPPHFYVSRPYDKEGAGLNGVRKDVVCVEAPVGNEYRGCPAVRGMPVNQPA